MKNIILSMVLGAALLGSAQACGCAAHRGQHHNDRHHQATRDGGKHHRPHRMYRPGYGWIRGAGNHTAAPKAEVAPSVHKQQVPQAKAQRKHKMIWGKRDQHTAK